MKRRLLQPSLPALLTAALLCGFAQAQPTQAAQPPQTQETAAAPDTIVVQAGDTAYSIARRAGLSVEAFLILNGLGSPDLKIGQTVIVRSGVPPYTVQAGDTLYSLARKFGLTVDALKAANTLPQDGTIAVGQTLKIPTPGSAPVAVKAPVTAPAQAVAAVSEAPAAPVATAPAPEAEAPLSVQGSNWRDTALSLMGTPYVFGGTTRRGTDCSGFVLQVFGPLGVKLPRVSADQFRAGVAVSSSNLVPGDLVFFDTVGAGRVTHVGIYLGNDEFINANSYRGRVTIDKMMSDRYWSQRYLGARRVLPANVLAMSRP